MVESSSDIEIIKNDPEPEMIHSNEIIQNNLNAADMLRQGLIPNFEMAQSNQSSLNKVRARFETWISNDLLITYNNNLFFHKL